MTITISDPVILNKTSDLCKVCSNGRLYCEPSNTILVRVDYTTNTRFAYASLKYNIVTMSFVDSPCSFGGDFTSSTQVAQSYIGIGQYQSEVPDYIVYAFDGTGLEPDVRAEYGDKLSVFYYLSNTYTNRFGCSVILGDTSLLVLEDSSDRPDSVQLITENIVLLPGSTSYYGLIVDNNHTATITTIHDGGAGEITDLVQVEEDTYPSPYVWSPVPSISAVPTSFYGVCTSPNWTIKTDAKVLWAVCYPKLAGLPSSYRFELGEHTVSYDFYNNFPYDPALSTVVCTSSNPDVITATLTRVSDTKYDVTYNATLNGTATLTFTSTRVGLGSVTQTVNIIVESYPEFVSASISDSGTYNDDVYVIEGTHTATLVGSGYDITNHISVGSIIYNSKDNPYNKEFTLPAAGWINTTPIRFWVTNPYGQTSKEVINLHVGKPPEYAGDEGYTYIGETNSHTGYVYSYGPTVDVSSITQTGVPLTLTYSLSPNNELTLNYTGEQYGQTNLSINLEDPVYGDVSQEFIVHTYRTPEPSFTISEQAPSIDDTITVTNTTTGRGSQYTYQWYVDNLEVEAISTYYTASWTDDKLDIAFNSPGSYTIKLEVIRDEHSRYVTSDLYVRPLQELKSRYSVVVFQPNINPTVSWDDPACLDNTYDVYTRAHKTPRIIDLKYERREDETGQASMRVLFTESHPDLSSIGWHVVVYDFMVPVFIGVITSKNDINNSTSRVQSSFKIIEFECEDVVRELSYLTPLTTGIYTGNPSDIALHILNNVGDTDDSNTLQYTFSVTNQSQLSLLDSFGNQCGCRYRTRPNILLFNGDCNITSTTSKLCSVTVLYDTGRPWLNMMFGDILFHGDVDNVFVGRKAGAGTQTFNCSYKYTGSQFTTETLYEFTIIGGTTPSSKINMNPSYLVDYKSTFYEDNDPITLTVNETAYDVDNYELIYNHYGSVCCVSPQDSGMNMTCEIPINNVVNEDYSLDDCDYIVASGDSYVADVEIILESRSSSYDIYSWNLYVYGHTVPLGNWECSSTTPYDSCKPCLVISSQTNTGDTRYSINPIHGTATERTYRYVKSIDRTVPVTKVSCNSAYKYYIEPSDFTTYNLMVNTVNAWNGCYISYPHYTMRSSHSGSNIMLSSETVWSYEYIRWSSNTLIYYDFKRIPGNSYTTDADAGIIHFPGEIVQYATAQSGSPASTNKNVCTINIQNNMDFTNVQYMCSKLVRYGSNFTKNITGKSSIKPFSVVNSDYGYNMPPEIGTKITLKKIGESDLNIELISYSINLNTMEVNFEAGMKNKNIGDILYNVNSNMSTNIN